LFSIILIQHIKTLKYLAEPKNILAEPTLKNTGSSARWAIQRCPEFSKKTSCGYLANSNIKFSYFFHILKFYFVEVETGNWYSWGERGLLLYRQ
jgi:hypothetical protein